MPSPSYWKSDVPNPSQSLLRNVPEGRCDRSLARSAWDSATPKSRPVGYGVIRAGVRTDSMIGVTKFRIRKLKTFMLYDSGLRYNSFHGKHFLVPEHSLRFQHKGTCLGPQS